MIPDGFTRLKPEDITQPGDEYLDALGNWSPSKSPGSKVGTWTTYIRPISANPINLRPKAARLKEKP